MERRLSLRFMPLVEQDKDNTAEVTTGIMHNVHCWLPRDGATGWFFQHKWTKVGSTAVWPHFNVSLLSSYTSTLYMPGETSLPLSRASCSQPPASASPPDSWANFCMRASSSGRK